MMSMKISDTTFSHSQWIATKILLHVICPNLGLDINTEQRWLYDRRWAGEAEMQAYAPFLAATCQLNLFRFKWLLFFVVCPECYSDNKEHKIISCSMHSMDIKMDAYMGCGHDLLLSSRNNNFHRGQDREWGNCQCPWLWIQTYLPSLIFFILFTAELKPSY